MRPKTSQAPELWEQSPSKAREAGSEERQGAHTALSVDCGAAVGAPLPGPLGGQCWAWTAGSTRVEEDDGAQAAQLRLVHLHVPHLGHQLRQHPVEGRGKRQTSTSKPDRAPPRAPQEHPRRTQRRPGGQLRRVRRFRQGRTVPAALRGEGRLLSYRSSAWWDFIPGTRRLEGDQGRAG